MAIIGLLFIHMNLATQSIIIARRRKMIAYKVPVEQTVQHSSGYKLKHWQQQQWQIKMMVSQHMLSLSRCPRGCPVGGLAAIICCVATRQQGSLTRSQWGEPRGVMEEETGTKPEGMFLLESTGHALVFDTDDHAGWFFNLFCWLHTAENPTQFRSQHS